MSSSSTTYPPGYYEQSRAESIQDTAIAFTVLVTVSFVLRALARWTQRTGFMWADFFMPMSLIFNLGVETSVLLDVRYGAGKHMAMLSDSDIRSFTKVIYYAVPILFSFAVVWPKLAILDLYLHIFVNKWYRWACYGVGLIMILNCIINVPIYIWQCHPFSQLWNPEPGGYCDNTHAHFTWSSFADIVTDFVMLLLPLPMIWRLQQGWATKIGIFLTFFVGNFGLATSIIRLVEFYDFGWGTATPDETWISKKVLIWSAVEPGVYHLCACFITFRPLFRWVVYKSPLSSMIFKVSLLSPNQSRVKDPYGTDDSSFSCSALRPAAPNAAVAPFVQSHNATFIFHDPLAVHPDEFEESPPYSEEERPMSQNCINVQHEYEVEAGVRSNSVRPAV